MPTLNRILDFFQTAFPHDEEMQILGFNAVSERYREALQWNDCDEDKLSCLAASFCVEQLDEWGV